MRKKLIISNIPEVGMGATIQYYSDRHAATIIQITHNGNRLILQEDLSIRSDTNGMSESQTYEFTTDQKGTVHIATKRKDNTFRLIGQRTLVHVGYRSTYHDFSF